MKKSVMRKLLAIAGCVTLFCAVQVGVSYAAPVDATVTANGQLVSPIIISDYAALDFAKFVKGGTDGSIRVYTDATDPLYVQAVKAGTTAPSAGSFKVNGDPSSTYVVSLPSTSATLSSGANSLTLSNIETDAGASIITDGTGGKIVKVGGTLVVPAAAVAGTYTGTFTVQVDYQ